MEQNKELYNKVKETRESYKTLLRSLLNFNEEYKTSIESLKYNIETIWNRILSIKDLNLLNDVDWYYRTEEYFFGRDPLNTDEFLIALRDYSTTNYNRYDLSKGLKIKNNKFLYRGIEEVENYKDHETMTNNLIYMKRCLETLEDILNNYESHIEKQAEIFLNVCENQWSKNLDISYKQLKKVC